MIKDTVQLQGFPQMKLPKFKGAVEIKLHNPTTGKTEIQRGENMVTNAVADIFATNPCGALDYRNLLPVWQKMYGGILCFANSLDDSSSGAADDYLMPDNSVNTVTAHAGQTAYVDQADDTTRGNPSSSNMSINDGTVTLAWEWGLSSGNGPISALALTHKDVGDAGTGSTSNAFQAISPIITNTMCGTFSGSISTYTNDVFFVGSDNYGYRFNNNENGTVTVTKIPFMLTSTGLVANKPFLDTDMNKTSDCSISESLDGGPCYVYDKSTHKLWLFLTSSSSASTTVDVEVIDLNDFGTNNWSATHSTLTIDSSSNAVGPLNFASWGTRTPNQLIMSNGYVYLPRVSNPTISYFVKVKLSNFSDQTRIDVNHGPWGGSYNYPAHKVIVGHYGVINNDVYYKGTRADPDPYINDRAYVPFTDPVSGLVASCFATTGGGTYPYYAGVSKFYIGTKYNLQTPVTKTPSQSMLITYTLTEVAPNE